jgi:hypothetical protein
MTSNICEMTASMVYWQEFPAKDAEIQVRFPALPDFLRSSGTGMGPTQPLNTTEKLIRRNSSGSGTENLKYSHRDPSR